MSIPIDKLYHYIEGIAKEIYNDDIIIYRFNPHGSKKLEDLMPLSYYNLYELFMFTQIYCYDQEPLNYKMYINDPNTPTKKFNSLCLKHNIQCIDNNIKCYPSIYDKSLLLHSEKRSTNLDLYTEKLFIPVYYWSHAIIALDWFRFAQYESINKNSNQLFLIYNRAWSGSREYRLKFIDLLIKHKLIDKCKTNVNAIEPELGIHYNEYTFTNVVWAPSHRLEDYSLPTVAPSSASADYEIEDYNSTEVEVVLETLFDDDRLQLTEKILRPIAVGQPFLLAATHGSLEYLRSYGFRTFGTVIDETYDTIEDPLARLEAIVRAMAEIANWTEPERAEKMAIANKIAAYNRKHFFSDKFVNQVTDELTINLKAGLLELEQTNTSKIFLNSRKQMGKHNDIVKFLTDHYTRKELAKIVTKARSYYVRSLDKD